MALPDAVLASDLKIFFNQGYTAGTGTLVDDKGLCSNLTESIPTDRPTWDTTSAPSGRGLLSFAGRPGTQRLDGGVPSSLPAWGGYWTEIFIIKRGTAVTTLDGEQILDFDGWENASLTFAKLYRSNSFSDNPGITNTNVHNIITVTNATTNIMTVYIDGVAQADLGSTVAGSGGLRTQWLATKFIGNRNNKSVPFNGLIGCIGLAIGASAPNVATLNAAMTEWWTTPAGGGGSNVTVVLPSPGREERGASVARSAGAVAFSFAAPVREERGASVSRSAGAVAFSVAAPAREEQAASANATATVAASLAAPRSEQQALSMSLLVSLTAAMSAAPAEERGAAASRLAGAFTSSLIGASSSSVVAALGTTWATAATLAPAFASESRTSLTLSRGALSSALAAVLGEERGGTISYLAGGPPPAIIASLAAPSAESHGLAARVQPSTLAVMAPAERAERGAAVARPVAGVVITLPTPRTEERASSSSSFSGAKVVALPAPARDERGGYVTVSFADAPPIVELPTHRSTLTGSVRVVSFVRTSGVLVKSTVRKR